jgi:hypothetical protein
VTTRELGVGMTTGREGAGVGDKVGCGDVGWVEEVGEWRKWRREGRMGIGEEGIMSWLCWWIVVEDGFF